jgi:hypothetical protein
LSYCLLVRTVKCSINFPELGFGGVGKTLIRTSIQSSKLFRTGIPTEHYKNSRYHNMSATLGKRKRAVAEPHVKPKRSRSESEESQSPEIDAQEIFRRHFEAQFAPLPVVLKETKAVENVTEEESEEYSEWGGISEPEEESVEVIEHSDAQSRMAAMSKEELKAFMVHLLPVKIGPC